MSSGLYFVLGSTVSVLTVFVVLGVLLYLRHRSEQRFNRAMVVMEQMTENEEAKDLLSMTSAVSYGLLLRQAILERCEGVEDDDERLSLVDDLVEIAEAYGDGLVKRSKSSHY